jgi:hypothetical protein
MAIEVDFKVSFLWVKECSLESKSCNLLQTACKVMQPLVEVQLYVVLYRCIAVYVSGPVRIEAVFCSKAVDGIFVTGTNASEI